jgi:quinol monooxygenase YgiN
MSTIVTIWFQGDPDQLERYADEHTERIKSVSERAKGYGVIAHRFYGSEDGQIMVVDEWPDAESFQAFFEAERDQIQAVMDAAGVTSEPEVTFWRKLETDDEIGWGA